MLLTDEINQPLSQVRNSHGLQRLNTSPMQLHKREPWGLNSPSVPSLWGHSKSPPDVALAAHLSSLCLSAMLPTFCAIFTGNSWHESGSHFADEGVFDEYSLLRDTLVPLLLGQRQVHKFRRDFSKFLQNAHAMGVGRLKSSNTALR